MLLTEDIMGKEIYLDDEIMISCEGYTYKAKLIKHTKASVGYIIWDRFDGKYIDKVYWASKGSRPYNNMYKIC